MDDDRVTLPIPPEHLLVFELLAHGYTLREIAAELHVCRNSVSNRVAAVKNLLGARSRSEALWILIRRGEVD
jgi:DNA-binding NarL/FixJ family response regulator